LGLEDQAAPPKGLLQAALDGGNSSGSSSSTAPVSNNSMPVKGKCLTQPAEPVSNDGLDNADGNLIVHENDRISVPSSQVHTLIQGRNRFRVISMLGQGTFAQVFKCQCLKTGDIVAVKVVKNKAAYTRQAAVEIDVFTALSDVKKENMVRLQCYFMYNHHLCLVFELLGVNLYEVLKKRQFRGLPLPIVRSLLQQALDGVKDLSQKNIVHCDLKPENILLSNEQDTDSIVLGETRRSNSMETTSSSEALSSFGETPSTDDTGRTSSEASSQVDHSLHRIKLIDFGSACFEGHASHTYIQSRFYRSPEVLIGLPYDSAIDMWSMGCVAAELFLGLPILPGVHEHDQLGRISEMIGPLPDRMIDQG
jgi:dual specificity protein kinase YAK1